MNRWWISLLLAVCLAGNGTSAWALEKVRFLPQWQPQAQFAGFFMAKAKGFYQEQGLDVEILRGGPGRPALTMLARGEAEFATGFLADAIRLSAAGLDLVNAAQLVKRSSLLLVAKKSSGVSNLADLEGRKISAWTNQFALQPRALLAEHGVDAEIVPQSATVNLLLMDGVAAATAMWYNEYHTILNSGYDPHELTVIRFSDTVYDFPEDGIYCRGTYATARPDTVRAFVTASLAGWEYAFNHPEETLDEVLARTDKAGMPTNRAHQRWMLARMQDIMQPLEDSGLLESDFARVARALEEAGMIARRPDYQEFSLAPHAY